MMFKGPTSIVQFWVWICGLVVMAGCCVEVVSQPFPLLVLSSDESDVGFGLRFKIMAPWNRITLRSSNMVCWRIIPFIDDVHWFPPYVLQSLHAKFVVGCLPTRGYFKCSESTFFAVSTSPGCSNIFFCRWYSIKWVCLKIGQAKAARKRAAAAAAGAEEDLEDLQAGCSAGRILRWVLEAACCRCFSLLAKFV